MKVKRKATLDGKEVEVEIEVEGPKTVKRKATLDGKEVEVEIEVEDPKTARTVSEMDPDELTKGLGKALAEAVAVTTGEAIERTLVGLGVGQVDRGMIVVVDDKERGTGQDEVRVHYGKALRAVAPSLEFHPDVMCLKTQEERDQKIMDALMIQDYFRSQVRHDFQRCENISHISWGHSWERQLLTGTTAAALIPKPLFAPIIEQRNLADKITSKAMQHRSENTTAAVSVENVVMDARGVAEGDTVTDTPANISYAPLLLTKKKAVGTAVSSRETMEDHLQAMQLVANLSSQAGRTLGEYNNEENMNGDGVTVSYTDGIITALGAGTTGTSGVISRVKLLLLINTIPSQYWSTGNLWWMMDQATLGFVGGLETANGALLYPNLHLVVPQVISGDGPGIGVNAVENIPVLIMPAATMLGEIALGNLDFFAVLVEDSIRVETTIDGGTNFDLDTQSWKFVQRQDGLVSLTAAFALSDGAITG